MQNWLPAMHSALGNGCKKERKLVVATGSSKSTPLSQQLLAMVRLSNSILQSTQLNDMLASVTRELSHLIQFDRSSIAVYDPEKNCLVLRHIYKVEKGSINYGENREIPMNETNVIGWVAKHLEPVLRNDIDKETRFIEMVKEENLKSDIIVPLIARGKLLGTLNVGSRRKNVFSQMDLEIVENCGKLMCVAVEHAMLLKEARELGDKYEALQKSANDIIIFINPHTGRLMEINRKAERALGFPREELLKKSYFELFAREDQYQARRDFINILSQKSTSFVDRRLIIEDGRILYVDINASLVQLEDGISIQAIIHDVSQRKMMEQQIIHQNKNLQEINQRLREVDEMKTEFLARISHELRTPLSIILAYSDSLKEDDLSREDRLAFLEVVEEQGQNLLDLINNLLDLSNFEISVTMLNVNLSHLHDIIRSIWPQVERLARAKNIKVNFSPGYEIPVIYIDNRRILQVLNCLIHNAIKFTEDGGSVDVRTSIHDEWIWVEVADTGEGIPADKIEGIFDTFQQIDGSISRKWGGMGIGLTMVKHIIELHGGKIWVESEYGRGSVFTFTLPMDTISEFLPEIYRGKKTTRLKKKKSENEKPVVVCADKSSSDPLTPIESGEKICVPEADENESS